MTEQCLLSIMEAADPDDRDDVAIRKLLVTALSSSGIELAQIMNVESHHYQYYASSAPRGETEVMGAGDAFDILAALEYQSLKVTRR